MACVGEECWKDCRREVLEQSDVVLWGGTVEGRCREVLEKSVCGEVLLTSARKECCDKCWRRMLEKGAVEKYWKIVLSCSRV